MPESADLPRVGIVTVCFHSMAVLPTMLASIPKGVSVVLVDNASGDNDGGLSDLANKHGAKLISNSENKGFGVACNQGAAYLDTEFLFFLNPDATLSEGCITALVSAASHYPDTSCFSPRVLDARGRMALRRRSRLLPRSRHWTASLPEGDCEIPLINGSAIFVKKSRFHAVGGFDKQIFLYHEDDDLGLRLKKRFGPIRLVYNAVVTHAEGNSTPRSPQVAAFKAYHMAQSALYTMRKHNRPLAYPRLLALALLQILSPENLLSARRRAKNWAFLKGSLTPIERSE